MEPPRLPYADLSPPETAALAEKIAAQRGSVLDLYRMLLHSPPMAEGWLQFLTAVRQKGLLPGRLREMTIIRVGILNGASYEAAQHAPIALREGMSQAQLDALADWPSSDRFDERERAILAYTDAMTREIQVPDAVFASVRQTLDERSLVELTITIATYNMVSRFLEALRIHA